MSTVIWDLWIDFQRAEDDGLTHANIRDLRASLDVKLGDVLIVGNEDAEPGVGEIIEFGDRGFLLVRVFPGSVEENRHRLRPGYASTN